MRIGDHRPGHPTRVAVDGISAAGKSTLARELAFVVGSSGRPVVHLTMDDFHHSRARRYRQGRESARGYFDDAFAFDSFRDLVLVPLGPKGNCKYRPRLHDLASDLPVDAAAVEAPSDAVVIVDGTFLQRSELLPHWDHRIYVEVSLELARARGIARDSALLGGRERTAELYDQRYLPAARLYLREVDPKASATQIFHNHDPDHPVVTTNPSD